MSESVTVRCVECGEGEYHIPYDDRAYGPAYRHGEIYLKCEECGSNTIHKRP